MYGKKVVTAHEMCHIEKQAFAAGASESDFMENAGKAIAAYVETYIGNHRLEKSVTFIAGKGNNGGDAFVAGRYLLQKGFIVTAFATHPPEECSPLCKKEQEHFKAAGGKVTLFSGRETPLPAHGVLLDGLVGTGFEGKAEGVLAAAIETINHASLPTLAIDIPSGLNGNTGEVASVAVHAKVTLALGLPKLGFFIGKGWNHIGALHVLDFGLPAEFVETAAAEAYIACEQGIFSLLPPLMRNRHKYQAGYVLAIAGSAHMPGAAALATGAALRSGCGLVRLFHEGEMDTSSLLPEVIREEWEETRVILKEAKRASSALIGPGLGRDRETYKRFKSLLYELSLPTVVDADALFFLAEHPRLPLPEKCILTPHRKEMERLLGKTYATEDAFLKECHAYAEQKKITLVLKGAPTFVFHEQTPPLIVLRGDPGMATAGSGDVLTGILAALLAQGLKAQNAAILGTLLHGIAGEKAAAAKTSYSMIASDIIDALPFSFKEAT
jgi:yjeF C-terminal region, hydroxyethylthiazole kinase-related/yjeF N-terminal region